MCDTIYIVEVNICRRKKQDTILTGFRANRKYSEIRLLFRSDAAWREAGCVIGAHPHAESWLELTIVTAGEGSVITNGTAEKVTAGDIYFSFPYEVHDIHASTRDKLEYDYMAFRRTDERTSAALEHIRMDYAGADRRVFRDDRINTLVGMALPEFADPG